MGIRVECSWEVWLLLALACMVLPVQWVLAALLAALVHELAHILAVIFLGGRILAMSIGPGGAGLYTTSLSWGRETAAILAGPAASILLLLLAQWLPKTAFCGLVQGLFNLLPVYPLDGGRALKGFLAHRWPGHCGRVCRWVLWITAVAAAAAGFWGTFVKKLGILPLMAALLVLSRAAGENFLANKAMNEYNRATK